MALVLLNLDERTRSLMLAEVESDMKNGNLYISSRLTPKGQQEYPDLLKKAIETGDDTSLTENLRTAGLMNDTETRHKQSGGYTIAKVPVTAPDTLAEGEFNRFYCRAVCTRAIEDGIVDVIIYRAKHVDNPRPESETRLGQRVNAQVLLQDLRTHQGVEPALGLPSGPNSGLSIKLP